MNRKVIVGAAVLVLLLCVVVFVNIAHPLGLLQMVPTPTPYVAPARSQELPAVSQRAQSAKANEALTTFNPWGMAFDYERGFVWVAEPGCEMDPICTQPVPGMIGKFSLADGSLLQEFQQPAGYTSPLFVAVAPDGHVWFTQPNSDNLGELDPQTTQFNAYPVKKGSAPYKLLFDKAGNLWFTEYTGNNIGFFNPKIHAVVETPVPTAASNPYGLTIDPQGTIWFSENQKGIGQLGSFVPTASGKITIVEHPVISLQPHMVIADKDGSIWFSQAFEGKVGRYDPVAKTTVSYRISDNVCPVVANCRGTHISGIAIDKAGNVWFTDSLSARVGYVVPATGALHEWKAPDPNAHPHDGLLIDNTNNVWVAFQYARTIKRWPGAKLPA